jgi:8-oxo-dGTP pyrophosphatase MutT (NUDIX family)
VTFRDELERYVCADAKERQDRDAMLALLAKGGDPFDRARADPGHFTGSAFVLDAPGERIVLVHHAKLDRWLQPGGHGEPGEKDPEAVALREATEETGIQGLTAHPTAPRPFDLDIHPIPERNKPGKPHEAAHAHLDVRYVFVAPAGAEPVLSEESHAVVWKRLEEAAAPDADASLRRAILKLMKLTARARSR